MTAADYFAGRDPALQTILAGEDVLPLPVLGEQFGNRRGQSSVRGTQR